MKRVNINVQEKIVEFLDKVVDLKFYPSRNEAIRTALKQFIATESKFLSDYNTDIVKLNTLHKKYVEFNEELKQKLFPAYSPIEKKVI